MTELYELTIFLGYDARDLVGKMFVIIDRFKINQPKFNNSPGTLSYHHNLSKMA